MTTQLHYATQSRQKLHLSCRSDKVLERLQERTITPLVLRFGCLRCSALSLGKGMASLARLSGSIWCDCILSCNVRPFYTTVQAYTAACIGCRKCLRDYRSVKTMHSRGQHLVLSTVQGLSALHGVHIDKVLLH